MSQQTVAMSSRREGDKLVVSFRVGEQTFVDRCDPSSSRSRVALAKAACKALPGLDPIDVEKELLAERDRLFAAPSPSATELDDPGAESDAALQKTPEHVIEAARAMLRDPQLLARVARDLVDVGIVGEHELAMSCYLLGTSRLLSKPLAAIVQGSSSSGKSYVVEAVAGLFPDEAKLIATDLTANALYYLPPGALRHRFVVAGERSRVQDDTTAERTRALREMISSGVLRKVLPVKNGDKIETLVIESPGPIAFIESTTLAEVFEEDRNRALLLASDDGAEQTRAVVDATARRYAGQRAADVAHLRDVHHAAQRILRRVEVHVPFAPALVARMPATKPDARRAVHQVFGLVQATAMLHQFQRVGHVEHGTIIEATVGDYRFARALIAAPLARSLGNALPDHVMAFARWLRTAAPAPEAFTAQELMGRAGCRWSKSSTYDLLKPLRGCGFLADAGQDGRANRYRVVGALPDDAADWLPAPEELQ